VASFEYVLILDIEGSFLMKNVCTGFKHVPVVMMCHEKCVYWLQICPSCMMCVVLKRLDDRLNAMSHAHDSMMRKRRFTAPGLGFSDRCRNSYVYFVNIQEFSNKVWTHLVFSDLEATMRTKMRGMSSEQFEGVLHPIFQVSA
jgi:hypothetical protein